MRILTIDANARARIAEVVAHAERSPYRPGPGAPPPGDDDRHVANLDSYRCVFSFTVSDEVMYRHLSVSIPGEMYPHPLACLLIATAFGFTGWREDAVVDDAGGGMNFGIPEDWALRCDQASRVVSVVQPTRSLKPRSEMN